MAFSAALLDEEPEESLYRLQRQRTTRIMVTIGALVAGLAVVLISVSLAYQNGPEAAASPATRTTR
jgi:hypothetical protein